MKLAWSIGHDYIHKGAYSKPLREYEYFLAKKVVLLGTKIIGDNNLDIKLFTPFIPNCEAYSAGQVLRQKISLINNWGADLALESHFNSSDNEAANGCEVLYFSLPGIERFSKKGKKFASLLQDNLLHNFNGRIKDRKIKGMSELRRVYSGHEVVPRFAFLTQTKMPAIIVEPLFISSPQDTEFMRNNMNKEIENIAKAVIASAMEYEAGVV